MDLNIVGEAAAILASGFWTICSIFFTSAGKKIGSLSVNAYRTVFAVVFLALTRAVLLGSLLPIASSTQWFWMGLSGVLGLSIGDSGLFAAYLTIGPRRSLLLMALSPIFAATGAYLMLGETIPAFDIVGMAITLAGVIVVILEREERFRRTTRREEVESLRCSFRTDCSGWAGKRVSLCEERNRPVP